jgi:hypothetical protein
VNTGTGRFNPHQCEKWSDILKKNTKSKKEYTEACRNNKTERQMKGCDADGTRSFTEQLSEMMTLL